MGNGSLSLALLSPKQDFSVAYLSYAYTVSEKKAAFSYLLIIREGHLLTLYCLDTKVM